MSKMEQALALALQKTLSLAALMVSFVMLLISFMTMLAFKLSRQKMMKALKLFATPAHI